MRKHSIFLMLLIGLVMPWAANAQETKVIDGGARGTMRVYKHVTTLTSGKNYLIVSSQTANSNAYALSQASSTSTSITGTPVYINAGNQLTGNTIYIDSEGLEPTAVWTANSGWTFSNSNGYSIYTDSSILGAGSLTANNTTATNWTWGTNQLKVSFSFFVTRTFYITPSSNGFSMGSSSANVYLYEETDLTVFDITATVSPSGIGTVTGTGRYLQGASCTLTATTNNSEFAFTNWTTMNGTVVSTANPYTFTVRADQDLVANFESIVSCLAPTNLSVINESITAHSAALSWTENGEATQWEVVYSTDANFDPDGATPTLVSNNPYTITGLAQSTTYYAYVRANCDATNQSAWSNQATFSTIAGNQAPTNLTLGTPEAHSITLSWTGVASNENHENYEVYYSTTNTAPSDDIASDYEVVDATSCTLSGLTPETTYYAWVRDNCGTDGKSAWSAFNAFTTAIACFAPTNVTASNVTNNSAVISWEGDAESFNLRYGSANEFSNTITEVTSPYTLTDLADYTDYEVQVQANCGSIDGLSQWSSVTFQTLDDCTAPFGLNSTDVAYTTATLSWDGVQESYNVQYRNVITVGVDADETFNFNNGTEGWTTIDADGHGNAWSRQSSGGHSGGCMMATYNSSYAHQDYLVSPQITLGGTISFYAKRRSNSYSDTFRVYLSTSGNTNASDFTIELTNGNVTPTNSYAQYTYDLSNYSGMGYVAIVYTAAANQWNLYIDDVSNSVHIPAAYGPYTTETNVTSPLEVTDLMPSANYEWQVQGVDCDGNGGTTDWSEAVTFSTLPVPTFTKTIEAYEGEGGYYLITSPLAESVSPATVGMITDELGVDADTTTSTYDLYRFDQNQDREWINYRGNAFDLVNGQGYLYASKGGATLTFIGLPNSSDEIEVTLTKTSGAEFEGWNLVGNPFGVDAYIPADRAFYTMQNAGVFTPKTGEAIGVMEGVFVIATEDEEQLNFTTTNPNSKISKLNLNLTKDNSFMDRAIVRFDEGGQLPKLQFRKGSTKVYIPQEGKDYAVVRSEEMGTLPVSFKAESNGTYTLSFNAEEVSFAYLHLIDNKTGIEANLLANPNYSFEAKTTDYENRFKLVFATGNNANDDAFAFFSNGSFVINNEGEAMLQVIDVNGRILKSESINGCANVNVNAAQGIYMLRLVNGDNVKVQKVVVK